LGNSNAVNLFTLSENDETYIDALGVETLADGYLKKIPLPRVPSIAQAQAHTAHVDLFRTLGTRTRTRVPLGHGTPVPLSTGTPIPHPHSCTSKILHRITHEMRQLANRIM